MGCNSSTSAHSPPLDAYATEKPKTPQKAINVASKLGPQRGSSDSLKAFSESALNVKLSTEKNLVLLWDGEVPSRNAYYEQAVMVLRIKGIEFTEEVVNTASPPGWYKVLAKPPLLGFSGFKLLLLSRVSRTHHFLSSFGRTDQQRKRLPRAGRTSRACSSLSRYVV